MTSSVARRPPAWRTHAVALAGYALLAVAFAWPLPLHLATHLTGSVGSDTGVYVWNQWVFRHELLEHGRLPYFTDKIFSLSDDAANLGLHNYTLFQNLLALPLIGVFGVVATFNLIHLLMTVLTAYVTFLLARHVTGRAGEAWLAGMVFAWSPVLIARGTGHFSLVAAAPVAAFLLVLLRADGHERLRDAAALGVVVWWAAATDVYYAIYCLLIGAGFLVARVVSIQRSAMAGRGTAVSWALDVMILCLAGLIAALVATGGWEFDVFGRPARIHSLYTPVLALTVLGLARIALHYRASWIVPAPRDFRRTALLTAVAGIVAAVLMSPVLYAVGVRIAAGEFDAPRIYWRSSPPGVDVLALLVPNPNHPLAPAAIVQWITEQPLGFAENVASIPWVLLGVLVVAAASGWRPPRWWSVMAVLFGLLALGPFVHVGGINTYVTGPWALLRFVPIAGLARTPARFSIVMLLALAVLLAAALTWLGRRYPERRRALLAGAFVLLAAELLPAPLTLYSAGIPTIYRHVAAAGADARVLELPFGVRDGTSSTGNFTARTQFYQTAHEKFLIGGYLSRVSSARVSAMRRDDMLDALMMLSEGSSLDPARVARLAELGPDFIARSRVSFVVIDRARTPAPLADFATAAFRLEHVETDGDLELYRPGGR